MNNNFFHTWEGPVHVAEALPPDYRGQVLRGARVLQVSSPAGLVLLQERENSHHSIQYNLFHFFRRFSLTSVEKNYVLQALLAVKNDVRYYVKGIGRIHLREGQFAMVHAPEKEFAIQVDQDQEYQVFETYYTRELVEQLMPFFPQLEKFFRRSDAGKTFLFGGPPDWAGTAARSAVYDMLHAVYDENLRRFYFDTKVREYLFLLLAQSLNRQPEKLLLTETEREQLIRLKDRLVEDTAAHYTIPMLARSINMNEFKLKSGFRQLFGMGIFEYRLRERMNEALRLLRETDKPMKEIASLTGYELLTSFITAFRHHFGYTPGSVRRRS